MPKPLKGTAVISDDNDGREEKRNKDAGGDVRSPFYTDFDKLARASNNSSNNSSNSNSNSYWNPRNKHSACDPRAFGSRHNTPDV